MDDETGVLAITERLPKRRAEDLPEIDFVSRGEYLELLDLESPASPSSSSDNSSCVTMSSDECFDSLALLQDLEPENDQVLEQKGTGYKCHVPASHRAEEVVIFPATPGSVHSIRSSDSSPEKIFKSDCPMPVSATGSRRLENKGPRLSVRSQTRDQRGEGPSSTPHNLSTSSGNRRATTDGQKQAAIGRMKRLRKKYLCFMPF